MPEGTGDLFSADAFWYIVIRMKILLFGENTEEAKKLLSAHKDKLEIVSENPEVVVTFGGDGTLMRAEHVFPGIPKLYLKNSHVGKLAHPEKGNAEIVSALAEGKYAVKECMKLEAESGGKKLFALNDIIVHNENPRHAIRYTVSVGGKRIGGEIIGDGVVLATPLGSTGYYRSITDSSFETGIGLAFNNSTEQSDHIVLAEGREIRMEIVRGPAIAYADNQKESIPLPDGGIVTIRKSSSVAKIVSV